LNAPFDRDKDLINNSPGSKKALVFD